MDLNQIRDRILADPTVEEKVEVNQRHLIDKILARYSAEFTVYRELLQNANDAGATSVDIVFHKSRSLASGSQQAIDHTQHLQGQELSSGQKETDDLCKKYNGLTFSEACEGISFRNNGRSFSVEDWNRLRKIAEGNPDEKKIGFFGVGFYSLFSICEEPFVISGNECMGFFWKGDQLYTKKIKVSDSDTSLSKVKSHDGDTPLTTFLMSLRDKFSPLPDIKDFGRFLATSLAFTINLVQVKVYLDDTLLFTIRKSVSDPEPLSLKATSNNFFGRDQSLYYLTSPHGLFTIQNVQTRMVQMNCEYVCKKAVVANDTLGNALMKKLESTSNIVNSSFGSLLSGWASSFKKKPSTSKQDSQKSSAPTETPEIAQKAVELEEKAEFVFLKIAQASLLAHADHKLATEMERATKKRPPSTSLVSVIWNSHDQHEALNWMSEPSSTDTANRKDKPDTKPQLDIFSQLLVFPEQGRVFIGFPTHQTTGCSAHLAAALIPTVERESIDFVDPSLAFWNKEVLSAYAILCRILYDAEMVPILQFYERAFKTPVKAKQMLEHPSFAHISKQCAHVLSFFCPKKTTPNPLIGDLLKHIFFACSKNPLRLITTSGLCSVADTRLLSLPQSIKSLPRSADNGSSLTSIPLSSLKVGHRDPKIPEITSIIRKTPLVPPLIVEQSAEMIEILYRRKDLSVVSATDIIRDLRSGGPLSDCKQVIPILKWWLGYQSEYPQLITPVLATDFLHAISFNASLSDYSASGKTSDTKVFQQIFLLKLSDLRFFLNTKAIHLPRPELQASLYSDSSKQVISPGVFPKELIPPTVSSQFTQPQLVDCFHGFWSEFSLSGWISYLIQTNDTRELISQSPEMAEYVLSTFGHHFNRIDQNERVLIMSQLERIACIPTNHGICIPSQAYFKSASFIDGLPIVLQSVLSVVKEPTLLALGVRKYPDLQHIFDRLSTELKWDHIKLLKYLAGIKDSITSPEWQKLREAHLFPAELASNSNSTTKYMRACDIHVPKEEIVNLGLPTLVWESNPSLQSSSAPGSKTQAPRWRDTGDEALVLFKLGLRRHPTCMDLLQVAAESDIDTEAKVDGPKNRRYLALTYFTEHYIDARYGRDYTTAVRRLRKPFIPAEVHTFGNQSSSSGNGSKVKRVLLLPDQCYSSQSASVMGFPTLSPQWARERDRLLVEEHPPISRCISLLSGWKYQSEAQATGIFSYLSSRQAEFKSSDWHKLQSMPFIPIFEKDPKTKEESVVECLAPTQCYFQEKAQGGHMDCDQDQTKPSAGSFSMFKYIDFGATAQRFLRACGVRDEPSPIDLALRIVENPTAFLEACGGWLAYLDILRKLAINASQIRRKSPKIWQSLKTTPCMVAIQRTSGNSNTASKTKRDSTKTLIDLDEGDVDAFQGDLGGELDETEYTLASISNIMLVDDIVLTKKFKPLTCPMEDILETFYESLGSRWLTDMVDVSTIPIGRPEITPHSRQLERIIKDRAPLLLYDFQNSKGSSGQIEIAESSSNRASIQPTNRQRQDQMSTSSSSLIRNIEWLKNNLSVHQVNLIQIRHKYIPTGQVYETPTTVCSVRANDNTTSPRQKTNNAGTSSLSIFGSIVGSAVSTVASSTAFKNPNSEKWNLVIAPINYSGEGEVRTVASNSNNRLEQIWDSFDVAMAIGKLVYSKCRLNQVLLLSTLISSDLNSLRRKGFPVDRVLRARAPKPKNTAQNVKEQRDIAEKEALGALAKRFPGTSKELLIDSIKKAAQEIQNNGRSIIKKSDAQMLTHLASQKVQQQQESQRNIEPDNSSENEPLIHAKERSLQKQGSDSGSGSGSGSGGRMVDSVNDETKDDRQIRPESPPPLPGQFPGSSGFDKLAQLRDKLTGSLPGGIGSKPQSKEPQQHQMLGQNSSPHPKPPADANYMDEMRSTLRSALSSTRVDRGSGRPGEFDLNLPKVEPPQHLSELTNSDFCGEIPPQRLKLVGSINEVEVYIDTSTLMAASSSGSASSASIGLNNLPLNSKYVQGLQRFANVLTKLSSQVFNLPPQAMHIFYDQPGGSVIAFNRNRTLFFNLRYYVDLGHDELVTALSGNGRSPSVGALSPLTNVYSYWFMIFCHELAHHIVFPHNAAHGFYMSSFAQEYMKKFVDLVNHGL
ncbi:hypothetical protein H4219_001652 [Mycoemilia scoparia]|uniref:HEPN domain-containing protein n=1 Tax=Mycoemilia scoparia TaxID=417184 RepID=A0A9W7ZZX9_9FUNG|nr:hypothetical protein H4219_001652 [Mycoemilia scoparia]